jgi:phage terminase small subunit
MPPLTRKQARFVQEYLIDLNATKAAVRSGYSKRTAQQTGSQIMSKIVVKNAIDAAMRDRADETKIDAAWVLKRLAAEAEADIADLYDDDGSLKPVKEWPKIWRQGLVQGIEIDALFEGAGQDRVQVGVTKKIRLDNRIRRIELIGKHIGVNAFQEQVSVSGLDALADRLARAAKRDDG